MIKKCLICNREFKGKPKQKCCSYACSNKLCWKNGTRKPKKKIGVYKNCLICGKKYYAIPYLKDRSKYCSKKCLWIATSKRLGGNHFNWKGGTSHGYKTKTTRNCLIKSGRTISNCEICKIDKFLQIHHKNLNKTDNRPENLMVLCSHCHQKLHNYLVKKFLMLPFTKELFKSFIKDNYEVLVEKFRIEVRA